jgi:hypothetical protein
MTRRAAVAALIFVLAVAPLALGAERGQARAVLDGKSVVIDYGRPTLRGRDMLAQAEIGKPWRMGADGATTLKTEADLAFGDAAVPSGDYVLKATRVAAERWELNIATADGTAVAAVPLAASALPESVETFTIELSAKGKRGELALKWGGTALSAPFAAR